MNYSSFNRLFDDECEDKLYTYQTFLCSIVSYFILPKMILDDR